MKAKLIISLLLGALAAGCYYDNEETLYNCVADAASSRYATTVNSILTSYGCKGCHGGSAPSGGVNLETYAAVKTVADNGRLYGAINHLPGFVPMPQGGSKMSDCDIKKIRAWLDAGAPNN